MVAGLKKFILRGNMVDLAIGVVVGAAFGNTVTALVKDLLTPLISAIIRVPDLSNWKFTFRSSEFLIGDFLNALISFVLIMMAIYFFVVVPVGKILARWQKPSSTKKCPQCQLEIPLAAKRCPHCTSPLSNIAKSEV